MMIYRYILLVFIGLAFLPFKAFADPVNQNNCMGAVQICNNYDRQSYVITNCATTTKLYYYFKASSTPLLSLGTFGSTQASTYAIYGPYNSSERMCSAFMTSPGTPVKSSTSASQSHDFTFAYVPSQTYLLVVTIQPPSCGGMINFSSRQGTQCGTTPVPSCNSSVQLCKTAYTQPYDTPGCTGNATTLFYHFQGSNTANLPLGNFTTTQASTYDIYGPYNSQREACDAYPGSSGTPVKSSASAATSHVITFPYVPTKTYLIVVRIAAPSCNGTISFSARTGANCGEEENYPEPGNTHCNTSLEICNDVFIQKAKTPSCGTAATTLFYHFRTSDISGLPLGSFTTTHPSTYKLYGPFADLEEGCDALLGSPSAVKVSGSATTSHGLSFPYISGQLYILIVTAAAPACNITVEFSTRQGTSCPGESDCADCIKGFQPGPGKYIVSAWVKEEDADLTTTTYTHPSIEITLYPPGTMFGPFWPSGRIIDGWQQIEGIFVVSDILSQDTDFKLELKCSDGSALFDDIRIFPFNASMLSYVYDPVTLRLVAELDERNYAKFYEYDEEGKLIRIKKETEKGIMTIQENRENSVK